MPKKTTSKAPSKAPKDDVASLVSDLHDAVMSDIPESLKGECLHLIQYIDSYMKQGGGH